MATFADFYQPYTGTPLGFTLGDLRQSEGQLTTNRGLDRFQMGRDFDRAALDTVRGFSARGAGRSSAKNQATNRLYEDYTFGQGRAETSYNQALADLQRQRRLATFGVLG